MVKGHKAGSISIQSNINNNDKGKCGLNRFPRLQKTYGNVRFQNYDRQGEDKSF